MEEEDGIDFEKLEKQFNRAVQADAKYQRENAAKFRAVEQRVGSYEEFKDIVAASHLKPLEKKDKMGQEKIKQPWNSLASKQNISGILSSSPPVKTKSSQQPLTPHNFTKTWKYNLKTSQERYDYLIKTGGQNLGQIFKTEIPTGVFGELITVLYQNFQSCDYEIVLGILEYSSITKRFSLTVEFLSTKEKELVKEVFRKLHEVLQEDSESKEDGNCRLKELAKLYQVDL